MRSLVDVSISALERRWTCWVGLDWVGHPCSTTQFPPDGETTRYSAGHDGIFRRACCPGRVSPVVVSLPRKSKESLSGQSLRTATRLSPAAQRSTRTGGTNLGVIAWAPTKCRQRCCVELTSGSMLLQMCDGAKLHLHPATLPPFSASCVSREPFNPPLETHI